MTNDERSDGTEKSGSTGAPSVRRPYRAPTLKYLGSVRELTLGGTQGVVRETRFSRRR